jgi:hypothetical protein
VMFMASRSGAISCFSLVVGGARTEETRQAWTLGGRVSRPHALVVVSPRRRQRAPDEGGAMRRSPCGTAPRSGDTSTRWQRGARGAPPRCLCRHTSPEGACVATPPRKGPVSPHLGHSRAVVLEVWEHLSCEAHERVVGQRRDHQVVEVHHVPKPREFVAHSCGRAPNDLVLHIAVDAIGHRVS